MTTRQDGVENRDKVYEAEIRIAYMACDLRRGLHILHPHRKQVHKVAVDYSNDRPFNSPEAVTTNLIPTFYAQFQLFALKKNFNFLHCLGLIDVLSVNKRAEILAVSCDSFLEESREERSELKGEGESSLALKEGLILRLTVKGDKMYTSKSNNIPLKRKRQIQDSETDTNNPASPSFRVCDCRAHAVYGPLVCSMECVHSRGQHLCKFIETKESVYIRKEFNSHRTGLGHKHGRRFIVLGHKYGRHDVM